MFLMNSSSYEKTRTITALTTTTTIIIIIIMKTTLILKNIHYRV